MDFRRVKKSGPFLGGAVPFVVVFLADVRNNLNVADVPDVEPFGGLVEPFVRLVVVAGREPEDRTVDRDHFADPADPAIVARKTTIWIRHDERNQVVAILFS